MKVLILDFDGTLADTRSFIVYVMQLTLAAHGLRQCTPEQCAATIGLPLPQAFVTLAGVSEEQAQQCTDTYRRIFDEKRHSGAVTLFPHVAETLKSLYEQGYTLAIATSRGRPSLTDFLHDFGLESYISCSVCVGETLHAKPHPEPVLKILNQLQQPPQEALVVGDTSFDIAMGRDAGCPTCGVTYGNQSREQLKAHGADYLIDDFQDLLCIVGELSQHC